MPRARLRCADGHGSRVGVASARLDSGPSLGLAGEGDEGVFFASRRSQPSSPPGGGAEGADEVVDELVGESQAFAEAFEGGRDAASLAPAITAPAYRGAENE